MVFSQSSGTDCSRGMEYLVTRVRCVSAPFWIFHLQEKIGPCVFRVISSDRDDLVLQAESKERMNDWLFGFHRALASIIARLMETGSRSLRRGDTIRM